jgi:hypothetical protein
MPGMARISDDEITWIGRSVMWSSKPRRLLKSSRMCALLGL